MIDVQTDEGFAKIKWVSPPHNLKGDAWKCHCIWHDGEGPLSKPSVIRAHPYKSKITPAEAAEVEASNYADYESLKCGDTEVIKIAVHIGGDEYARYAVTVKIEATFEAREI